MVDDYMLDKVLGKVKLIIGIEKFNDTQKLTDTDDQLADEVTQKSNVILSLCVIKDDKCYSQIILKEALVS